MKDLKFRVFHRELKKFLPKDEWFLDLDGNLKFYEFDYDNGWSLQDVDQSLYIIQQFTGLLDKSGREIYEGDIIKHINIWEIVFYEGSFVGRIQNATKDLGGFNVFCEIIGNILENPELLKN